MPKEKEEHYKIIGGYKRQGWAVKVLENIENDNVEKEGNGNVLAKAVLKAADETYYPAFLSLSTKENGKINGLYLTTETDQEYQLIPFEMAKDFIGKKEGELLPFQYRTLEKIPNDQFQKNWPEFS